MSFHHLRPQHMVSYPKTALRKKNIVKFLLTGIKSIVYNDKCAISSLLGALRLNYVRYGRVSVPGLLSKITIRRCNSWQPNVPISPKSFMVRKYTASARECPPRMVGKSLPAAAPRVALDCLTDWQMGTDRKYCIWGVDDEQSSTPDKHLLVKCAPRALCRVPKKEG